MKDFPWAGLQGFMGCFDTRVVSLQWALLWRILHIRSKPVTRSRGSEEGMSGFSWCVLDHWKNSHHSNVTHLRDSSVKAETWASCHQKRKRLFTVVLGWDGEPSHLADHKPSGLPPLKISSVTEHSSGLINRDPAGPKKGPWTLYLGNVDLWTFCFCICAGAHGLYLVSCCVY